MQSTKTTNSNSQSSVLSLSGYQDKSLLRPYKKHRNLLFRNRSLLQFSGYDMDSNDLLKLFRSFLRLRFQHHCYVFVFEWIVYIALVKAKLIKRKPLSFSPPPCLHLCCSSSSTTSASPSFQSFKVKLASSCFLIRSTLASTTLQIFQALIQAVLQIWHVSTQALHHKNAVLEKMCLTKVT